MAFKILRSDRYYSTGDATIDAALTRLHRLTIHHPEYFNADSEMFDRLVSHVVEQLEELPRDHPVRLAACDVYTSGAHRNWNEAQCRLRYQRLITRLWPALDAIE